VSFDNSVHSREHPSIYRGSTHVQDGVRRLTFPPHLCSWASLLSLIYHVCDIRPVAEPVSGFPFSECATVGLTIHAVLDICVVSTWRLLKIKLLCFRTSHFWRTEPVMREVGNLNNTESFKP
jgi:hypothetical protein